MYVVRRSFKNFGNVMLPGSTVEPDSIKMFKTRLKDRTIIEVNAHDFDKWNEYFKNKYGVEIQVPSEPVNADGTSGTTGVTVSSSEETTVSEDKTEKATVKPVVKVVVTAKN